jgi:hypothetical protein
MMTKTIERVMTNCFHVTYADGRVVVFRILVGGK